MISVSTPTVQFVDIAQELSVSMATVRNWVKTGQLKAVSSQAVEASSYREFRKNAVGIYKLNKRANKTQTIDTNQLSLLRQASVDVLISATDELSVLYEQSLSNTVKNVKGIYYTPSPVVMDFFNRIPPDNITAQTTFCDPCCGTGNFLLGAVEAGIDPTNIAGFDTDEQAITIAKSRFFQKTGYLNPNIHCVDTLKPFLQKTVAHHQYDIVMTNPPWGKNPVKPYAALLPAKTLPDACILFTQLCLTVVKRNGIVGLLLPDAYFNIGSFKEIRQVLLTKKLLALVDYGRPFKGLQSRAEAIILQNTAYASECLQASTQRVQCVWEQKITTRDQQSFLKNPEQIFNFHVSLEEDHVLQHILSKPYTTLKNKALWGMGIVTGNNNQYIAASQTTEHTLPIYSGVDIKPHGCIEFSHQFLNPQFEQFQQVAPVALYQAPQKIVYRFISDSLRLALDEQQRFFLNSVNFFILKEAFPIEASILVEYFNSKTLNWMFKSLFRTHKVLRKDLEQLPIFLNFLTDCSNFDEKALQDYLDITELADGTFRLKI
jgi:site-specific DNA-methyltransferase (adenine-specific)